MSSMLELKHPMIFVYETGDIVSVGYYRLSFDTYGGEGSHLGYRNPQTFSDESTQLLDYMAGLQGPLEKPVTVKVRIPVNHYDRLTIASYRMSFHQFSLSERRVPYQAYFNNRRNPQIQYPDFLQRDVIFRNSQYVPDESEFEVESVKTAAPATTDTDSAVTTGKVTAPAVATQQNTQTRDEERVGGIIPHQARDSYYSLFEYLVKFRYGLAVDHQKQNEDITAINGRGSRVSTRASKNTSSFRIFLLRIYDPAPPILQGILPFCSPETGKTKTLAAIMVFLLSIGYNCLGAAPTHAAADNLAEELSKLHADPYWNANKIPFPKPLRVYPPSQEQAAMKKEGRPTREEFVLHHADDDDDDEDDDETEADDGDAGDGEKKSAGPLVKDAD